MKDDVELVRGSGNVFADFGDANAEAEQLKAMLKSYVEGDGDRFLTISMQVAAHAARKGQEKLARELRELIDEAKERAVAPPTNHAVPIARLPGDLGDLIAASYPKTRMVDMVLSPPTRESFGMHRCGLIAEALLRAEQQGVRESEARLAVLRERLTSYGLDPERLERNPTSRYPYRLERMMLEHAA